MVLPRSPAVHAGHDAVGHFYSAFFAWSRLLSSQSLRHHRRPTRSWAQLKPRAYSTTHDVPAQHESKSSSVAKHTVFLTEDDCHAVTENNNALLKQLARDTGIKFRLDTADAQHKHRRLWLSGHVSALHKATRRLLELGGQSSVEDDTAQQTAPPTSTLNAKAHGQFTTTKSFPLSKDEVLHLDTLSSQKLEGIKTETNVDTIAVESGPHDHPVLNIKGTKHTAKAALLQVRSLLANADSAFKITEFRSAMRAVPSSVAVITTAWPDSGSPDRPINRKSDRIVRPGYRGMTVSSLTAVSLSPTAVVSFNIRKPSRTLDALEANGFFYVHIPSSGALGKTIADAFTKPHEDPSEAFHQLYAQKNISVAQGRHLLPKIGGLGVQLRYRCRLLPEKSVDIGDHVVLFAEVEIISRDTPSPVLGHSDNVSSSNTVDQSGIVYVHGKYGRVSEIVEEVPEVVTLADAGPSMTQPPIQSGPSASSSSEVEWQQSGDLAEKYFQDAEEDYQAPGGGKSQQAAATSATQPDTTVVPTGKLGFLPRRRSLEASSGHERNSRQYSTSFSKPGSNVDPSILSQTVGEYLFQPFDPNNKKRLARLRTRMNQKAALDKVLRSLKKSHESGDMDEVSFETTVSRVLQMREAAIANELVETELDDFLRMMQQGTKSSGQV